MYCTDMYEGMIAETISVFGHGGDSIHAYLARPLGEGPFPGVVLLHHAPGWDNWYKEFTRLFAAHGYVALAPDLYCRVWHGETDEVGAKVRAAGGVPDDQVVGDAEGSMRHLCALPYLNGKVGVIGSCSGGRHTVLAASRTTGFDAAVDLWGGNVVMQEDQLTPARPVAPIEYTKDLSCPLLGLFGVEDTGPTPEQVAQHEAELKRHGKTYEFHMYEGAGHGFFYHDRAYYRQEQAVDGMAKMFAFFQTHLQLSA